MRTSRVEQVKYIESRVRRYNEKFQTDRQPFDVWNKVRKGFRATGISIVFTRIGYLTEGGSWITYEASREEQPWEQGVYKRVRFRSCGTVGYGPTMWVKSRRSSDILYGHDSRAGQSIACQLCWQQRWYQGRGTKRTILLLVETRRTNRQSSRPSVVTEMLSTI